MTTSHRCIVPLLALGLGIAIGRAGIEEPAVRAETRRSPPREAFKSGAARSESLLAEIRDTLQWLDGRVERIEERMTNAD